MQKSQKTERAQSCVKPMSFAQQRRRNVKLLNAAVRVCISIIRRRLGKVLTVILFISTCTSITVISYRHFLPFPSTDNSQR